MNAFNVRSISFTRFLLVVSIVVAWCGLVWLDACWPRLSAHDSVAALNGGAGAFSNLVYHERIKNDAVLAASGWTIFALAALALSFYPSRWRIRAPVVLAMIAAIPLLQGCARPYDTPEYEDVDTAETAFVVPVEGDTADQA